MKFLGRFMLFLLLVLPSTIMLARNEGSPGMVAYADEPEDSSEDIVEGEADDDDEAIVETDEGGPETGTDAAATEQKDEDEDDDKPLKASPVAKTNILFTKPTGSDLHAGSLVRFLVGFSNDGDKDFVVETMEASFRYPQDFSFYIQNFTTVRYDRTVEPSRQATFEYAFTPSENFHARPFGLTINLNYKDTEGNLFQDSVFNDTVNIIEYDEGLDGETFFLYVFLVAVVVLVLVGAQQLLSGFGKKRLSKPFKPIETGTQNDGGVDYSWLPQDTIQQLNKSPKRSPKQSPRQRHSKRRTGGGDE